MNVACDVTAAILLATTTACAFCDARTGSIPNRLTYPAFAALVASQVIGGNGFGAILGAAVAAGALFALFAGTRGRGLGLGDVKLAACMGAGLGASLSLVALGVSFVAGGAACTALLATGRVQRGDAIRFGPYLTVGTFAAYASHLAGVVRA
jgi:leader peptidase (prepilin peptidase)/N-methyltransferase